VGGGKTATSPVLDKKKDPKKGVWGIRRTEISQRITQTTEGIRGKGKETTHKEKNVWVGRGENQAGCEGVHKRRHKSAYRQNKEEIRHPTMIEKKAIRFLRNRKPHN